MDLSSLRKNYRTTINYQQLSQEFLRERRKNSANSVVSKSPIEQAIVCVKPFSYQPSPQRRKSSSSSLAVSFKTAFLD